MDSAAGLIGPKAPWPHLVGKLPLECGARRPQGSANERDRAWNQLMHELRIGAVRSFRKFDRICESCGGKGYGQAKREDRVAWGTEFAEYRGGARVFACLCAERTIPKQRILELAATWRLKVEMAVEL